MKKERKKERKEGSSKEGRNKLIDIINLRWTIWVCADETIIKAWNRIVSKNIINTCINAISFNFKLMSARYLRVRMEPVVRQLMMVTAVSHVLQDGRGKIVMKVWYKTKLNEDTILCLRLFGDNFLCWCGTFDLMNISEYCLECPEFVPRLTRN